MSVSAASFAISRNGEGIVSRTRISSSGRSQRTRVSSSGKNTPAGTWKSGHTRLNIARIVRRSRLIVLAFVPPRSERRRSGVPAYSQEVEQGKGGLRLHVGILYKQWSS